MDELRRKFYDYLVSWKASKRQECLLIKGARQVGKTYIVEKFGREQYESFFEFNFVLDGEAAEGSGFTCRTSDSFRRFTAPRRSGSCTAASLSAMRRAGCSRT